MIRSLLGAAFGAMLAVPALAELPDPPFTGAQIEAATFTGQDLPPGRSPLTAKVQILLDRAGTSPGVTDGFKGAMSHSAIMAFERRMGLPTDGVLDAQVWAALQPWADAPITQTYTIVEADFADLVAEIPTDYLLKANMVQLGYTSVAEKLGERFHMDEKFVQFLNPGVALQPGATITVMAPGRAARGIVTRVIIDKATRRVAGYDDKGRMLVDYPATIGSDATPSPSGHVTVVATALNPEYTYNPRVNFTQGENTGVLKIPPGPNGPVGTVWIALSKPTYGIHGGATPSRLFHNQSHGCVRLTNWDAEELAHMVRPGLTRVEFLEPGTSIADVTEKPAMPTEVALGGGSLTRSARPPLRGVAPVQEVAAEAPAVAPLVAPPVAPLSEASPAEASLSEASLPADSQPQSPLPETPLPSADPLAEALSAATEATVVPVAPTAPGSGLAAATMLPVATGLAARPTPRPVLLVN